MDHVQFYNNVLINCTTIISQLRNCNFYLGPTVYTKMYSRIVFKQHLVEAEGIELPSPVAACVEAGRSEKTLFSLTSGMLCNNYTQLLDIIALVLKIFIFIPMTTTY